MVQRGMSMSGITFGLAVMLVLPVASASAADDARAGVEAANRVFEATFSRSDSAGLAGLYTADGQLLPNGGDFVTGTAAIASFWQALFDSGITGVSLKTIEVESHGDTATEVGSLELRDGAGNVADRGKYIVLWKRQGGTWKLHRDIWNTSGMAK